MLREDGEQFCEVARVGGEHVRACEWRCGARLDDVGVVMRSLGAEESGTRYAEIVVMAAERLPLVLARSASRRPRRTVSA